MSDKIIDLTALAANVAANLPAEVKSKPQGLKYLTAVMSALAGKAQPTAVVSWVESILNLDDLYTAAFPVTTVEFTSKGEKLAMLPELPGHIRKSGGVKELRSAIDADLLTVPEWMALPDTAPKGARVSLGKGETLDLAAVAGNSDLIDALSTVQRYTQRNDVAFTVAHGVAAVKMAGKWRGAIDAEGEALEMNPDLKPAAAIRDVQHDARLTWRINRWAQLSGAGRNAVLRELEARILRYVDSASGRVMGVAGIKAEAERCPDRQALIAYMGKSGSFNEAVAAAMNGKALPDKPAVTAAPQPATPKPAPQGKKK